MWWHVAMSWDKRLMLFPILG